MVVQYLTNINIIGTFFISYQFFKIQYLFWLISIQTSQISNVLATILYSTELYTVFCCLTIKQGEDSLLQDGGVQCACMCIVISQ